jgi:hypothetical protein
MSVQSFAGAASVRPLVCRLDDVRLSVLLLCIQLFVRASCSGSDGNVNPRMLDLERGVVIGALGTLGSMARAAPETRSTAAGLLQARPCSQLRA